MRSFFISRRPVYAVALRCAIGDVCRLYLEESIGGRGQGIGEQGDRGILRFSRQPSALVSSPQCIVQSIGGSIGLVGRTT